MPKRKRNRIGNATIEFTLVGIPLVFVLISTIEMARGMWIYHTLAYAIKGGTRYTVARGQNNSGSNHATYQGVCTAIIKAGAGLLPEDLSLVFRSNLNGTTFVHTTPPFTAQACLSNSNPWPPAAIDDQPGQTISISGYYPFVSAISMFWPGAGPGMTFQSLTCNGPLALCLPAASQDIMQF
jgi:Flp pilus assembly protein TadG